MDICGFVHLHCMFRMLRDQNLAPLNCSVSFETLISLENSHFIEYKVLWAANLPSRYCAMHACKRRVRNLEAATRNSEEHQSRACAIG